MYLLLFIIIFVEAIHAEIPAKITFSSKQDDYRHPNYYRQGTSVTFNCVATGYPPPAYKWFRNDRLLNIDSENTRIMLSEGNLTINRIDHSLDDGIYQCLAYNDFGSDVSHALQFKIQVIGKFLHDQETTEVAGTIGRPLLIACPETSYFYPKIYDWGYHSDFTNHVQVKQDHRVNVLKNGTLFFSYLTEDDVNKINDRNGIQCFIYSGNQMTHSKTFRISPVQYGEENDFAPYFLENISGNLITRLDAVVRLQCSAVGRPVPDIVWYHNNHPINNSMHGYRMKHSHFMLEITIQNINMAGKYMCKLNNSVDKKEFVLTAEKEIIVDTKPHWLIEPQDQYILPGGHLHIFCLARGIPRPTHQWYQNGERIESSHKENGTNMTDGILEIPSAQGVNQYECRATNTYGEIRKIITVTAVVTTTTTTTTTTPTLPFDGVPNADESSNRSSQIFVNSFLILFITFLVVFIVFCY